MADKAVLDIEGGPINQSFNQSITTIMRYNPSTERARLLDDLAAETREVLLRAQAASKSKVSPPVNDTQCVNDTKENTNV